MSRILESMKTRVAKLTAKIKPLIEEVNNLNEAIKLLEKQETITPPPASPTEQATLPEGETPPAFLTHKHKA